MKFTILTHKEIYTFFKIAQNLGADYLYLADSFGNCEPRLGQALLLPQASRPQCDQAYPAILTRRA